MAWDSEDKALTVKTFGTVADNRFPGPVKLAHVGIAHAGPSPEAMLKFYMTVLNMRLVYRYDYPKFSFYALSADDENHRIGLIHLPYVPAETVDDRSANRIEHTSWAWAGVEDILITCDRIHDELGIWPNTARIQGRDITLDYLDPDGNRCELLTQMNSQAQILHRIEDQLGAKGGREERDWTDTYAPFDMARLVAHWRAGKVPPGAFLDQTYLKGLLAEGVIALDGGKSMPV